MRSRTMVCLVGALALLGAVFFGCRTQLGSSVKDDTLTPSTGAAQAAAFAPGSACETACADTSTEQSWAVCYSCRCKAAMDGYLPTAAEISCAAGKELKVFRLEGAGSTATLQPVTGEVPNCINPDHLREGCHPGSRLVQIKHGDVQFKAICKRESFVADYNNLSIPFEETGFIGHNNRTGATCYWNDMGESNPGLISGTNQPEIDLTAGDPDRVQKYLEKYYNVKDDHCTVCHDNDPFMYSPHLQSSGWVSDTAYTNGPYNVVRIDGSTTRVPHKHLVSDDASACTECHRISDGNTCASWARDSAGFGTIATLQPEMHAAAGTWRVLTEPTTGMKWTIPYWMPKGGSLPTSQASWNQRFGKAIQTIQKCCANPSADGCQWEPIPATADEAGT